MNSEDINITIKEYIPNFPNDDIKLSIEIFANHFLPDIKPYTIFYENKTINDENKYNEIVKIIDSNIETIKKLNLENISSFSGGLQQQITIKLEDDSYLVIGNTDNREMKQLYIDLKEKILKIINQNDRSDYFTYKQADIQFRNSQCDFCKYNDLNNKSICVKYPSGKPNNIINAEIKCEYLEIIEKQNDIKKLFEKDSNGSYIRLIIPSEFVCLILPECNGNMDLRGKNNEELTTDEVSVLKKYAYELSENNKPTKLYYKQKETDIIWWIEDSETIGERLFTFDKEKIFNLFRDYPHALTSEQKEIFDKENPYWADYFKDRN